ncbi:AAA family ATPase [Cellulosilyticum ruminicola]|uniref:AAA family ATPase n=1 Tax=Cellulosilyticum ruminicola TaxID=425254 RepID=UPI0006D2B840|nr:AAA family ATPase [Cellulosilyticum ruminicola]
MGVEVVQKLKETLLLNIGKVIRGKDAQINKVIMALLCEGHILLEDIPGTGKTTMAKSLAKSINCDFKRIQFTPDLLPTDLLGLNFYNQKAQEFVFKEGPIFTQILLADEINRATSRTQSSLLECMEEGQVTIDGVTRSLEKPFLVIATQNPIETQGTFPLPEAQLDRFFIRLSLGYPSMEDELAVLTAQREKSPLETLECVVTKEEIKVAQEIVKGVKVSEEIQKYIIQIVTATREEERFRLGLSMRGSLAMMRGAQALAAMEGRNYVIPDDVKKVVKDVALHRIIYKGHSLMNQANEVARILDEILTQVTVPLEENL